MQTIANNGNTMKIWWKENRKQWNTIYCVFVARDQTPRYLPLRFCVLKHLYKAVSSFYQVFQHYFTCYCIIWTMTCLLEIMKKPYCFIYSIPLFYLYYILLCCSKKSITICFNKDEMKYWEWSIVEKQAGICFWFAIISMFL